VFQYVKLGDLTSSDYPTTRLDSEPTLPSDNLIPITFADDFTDLGNDSEPRLTDDQEDALLLDTTASFADWVANFIRRVIQLLENLPEEGESGSATGATEGIVSFFDAVCALVMTPLS
jgi:proteasome activator subunit 4